VGRVGVNDGMKHRAEGVFDLTPLMHAWSTRLVIDCPNTLVAAQLCDRCFSGVLIVDMRLCSVEVETVLDACACVCLEVVSLMISLRLIVTARAGAYMPRCKN